MLFVVAVEILFWVLLTLSCSQYLNIHYTSVLRQMPRSKRVKQQSEHAKRLDTLRKEMKLAEKALKYSSNAFALLVSNPTTF